MALIQCSECGREVSDQASSCPGCGAPTGKSPIADTPPKETTPIIGIVAIGLGLASILMPYFAAVFLVPAAFICGVIAFRRGQKRLGGVSIVLAILGIVGIFAVSQQMNERQAEAKQNLEKAQRDMEDMRKKAERDMEKAQKDLERQLKGIR